MGAVYTAIGRTPWLSVAVAWLCLIGIKALKVEALSVFSPVELAAGALIAGLALGAWPRAFGTEGVERWGIFAFVAMFAALPPVAVSSIAAIALDLARGRSTRSLADALGGAIAVAGFIAWIATKGVPADAPASEVPR